MSGQDQQGSHYPSIDAMWQYEINLKNNSEQKQKPAKVVNPIGSISDWYSKANTYWNAAQPTYDGVLSGYGHLSKIDIEGSFSFVNSYLSSKGRSKAMERVLDCGAGIGRVAKQLLCSLAQTVDVIDQCEKYIEKSKQILKDQKIGHFYAKGLQEFNFEQKYDCIWVQWVLSHLTDPDAIEFLKKAKSALKQEGFIVVKENHTEQGFLLDKDDCSVSRSSQMYKKLFKQANIDVVKQQFQKNWPKDLLDVKMYLLQ